MNCKHPSILYIDKTGCAFTIRPHHEHGPHSLFKIKCRWCGGSLPIGPSNDEPQAVRTEMRAAELVALRMDPTVLSYRFSSSGSEFFGFSQPHAVIDDVDEAAWQAGYLGRFVIEDNTAGGTL